jgi:hypothetical protein
MENVTLEDMLKYPIWTFALDEEGEDGQDETWQAPILDTNDVKPEYIDVYILLKMENSDKYVSANLDIKGMTLSDIGIWENSWWNILENSDVDFPIYLVSIPDIKGKSSVKFIVENNRADGKLLSE